MYTLFNTFRTLFINVHVKGNMAVQNVSNSDQVKVPNSGQRDSCIYSRYQTAVNKDWYHHC